MKELTTRSLGFDYAVGVCGVWISSGFFLDAWSHGHTLVESFFSPSHAMFYSGMLAMIVVLAAYVARHRGVPPGYRLALLGIPIFVLGGFADMIWHFVIGLEEGIDALLSPTHLTLGLGIFFLSSGPIRSVLRDARNSRTLRTQLPLVLGLVTWLILMHFATAYAFDPAAGRTNAPPSLLGFTPDYLTAIAVGYYKTAMGVLVLLFQSTLMVGFALWATSRMRLAPGSFTLLYVLANIPAAAAFTDETPLLFTTIVQSALAGLVADWLVARTDPQPGGNPRSFYIFAIAVPMTYAGAYLVTTFFADRIWWDWNIALGAWSLTGLLGFFISLIGTARRAA